MKKSHQNFCHNQRLLLTALLCLTLIATPSLTCERKKLCHHKKFYEHNFIRGTPKHLYPCPDTEFLQHIPAGYTAETHSVTTEDGYVLKVFRVTMDSCANNPHRRIILIQHGVMSAADAFVINHPDKALGFVLAQQCYDVWLYDTK